MKLGTLLESKFKSGLTKLSTANLPLKVTFKLKGIINDIETELKKYEEVRQAALKKYCKLKEDGTLEVDEVGNAVFKDEENLKAFFKEIAELSTTEVDIGKLKLTELGDNAVNVSVEELHHLESIIEL